MKYGSSSDSLNWRDSGGKRPKISGPGTGGAGPSVASVGDVGDPAAPDVAPPVAFSFAEDEGTGSQPWARVGFAGLRGGALRLFLGTDDAG